VSETIIGNDENHFTIFIASINNPLFIWWVLDGPSYIEGMNRFSSLPNYLECCSVNDKEEDHNAIC
jgi:hypothetical protein